MTDRTPQTGAHYVTLEAGDPAPQFSQRALRGEFNLANLGGAPIVLAFFMSSSGGVGKAVLEIVAGKRNIFETGPRFLAVTVDRADEARLKEASGLEVILDFDGKVCRRYGAIPANPPPGASQIQFHARLVILDRRQRVIANLLLKPDGSDAARITAEIEKLPALAAAEPALSPPILIVPRVFPAEFCRQMIERFEAGPHSETGIVSQSGETTSIVINRDFKRRRDYGIEDAATIEIIKAMLKRRLLPEIAKAFQFHATHVERHIICRYTAEEGGHFRAHRDNTSRGAAYRRFAATINLNEDFEGGTLSFPEFGPQSFKAPLGGAIVFSCSLLHEVAPMTAGSRYAYLPFFFDDAAARILEDGRASWAEGAPALSENTRL